VNLRLCFLLFAIASVLLSAVALAAANASSVLVPRIVGDWWQVAGDPDLSELTATDQQPVDFGVWQAVDGSWQLWSCIRKTKETGNTRLFHRWEGTKLTDSDWVPRGIAMRAGTKFGETPGGLQAPFVMKDGGKFLMFYGDWENICAATSAEGKRFERRVGANGRTGMFGEGPGANARDPMVLRIDDRWHCYYTAHPNRKGSVYCRTSSDTREWSGATIVAAGGRAGEGPYSAECPFVVELKPGQFYLFRTQRYGPDAQTSVYCSTDPLDFGVNDDRHFVGTLPIAAPEIFLHEGDFYVAALLPNLKGIRLARLEWVPAK
jgi:hypothetical protein